MFYEEEEDASMILAKNHPPFFVVDDEEEEEQQQQQQQPKQRQEEEEEEKKKEEEEEVLLVVEQDAELLLEQADDDDDDDDEEDIIHLAGIFDVTSFDWGPELFQFVVELLNEPNNGFHDDIFDNIYNNNNINNNNTNTTTTKSITTRIEYTISDSACNANQAFQAYWNIRNGIPPASSSHNHHDDLPVAVGSNDNDGDNDDEEDENSCNNNNQNENYFYSSISSTTTNANTNNNATRYLPRPHGIIGCRCSGASIPIARISGHGDGIVQMSPSSTSTELSSNIDEFPLFFRTVSPDNEKGQVGALVSAFQKFGWERDRIIVLATETPYARAFSSKFEQLWTTAQQQQQKSSSSATTTSTTAATASTNTPGTRYLRRGKRQGGGGGGTVYTDFIPLKTQDNYKDEEEANGDENNSNSNKNNEGATTTTTTTKTTADSSTTTVDLDALEKVLKDIPSEKSLDNSRVILLIAHEQHAHPILKKAREMNFQKDAIWFGPQAWAGRLFSEHYFSQQQEQQEQQLCKRQKGEQNVHDNDWFQKLLQENNDDNDNHGLPGYFGVSPRSNRNTNLEYQDFLQRINEKRSQQGQQEPWKELPDYAAEQMVDSIVALSKAILAIPREERRRLLRDQENDNHNNNDNNNNFGQMVAKQLETIEFNGISGPVAFTKNGDRKDPQFAILNYQPLPPSTADGADGAGSSSSGGIGDKHHQWVAVGQTGTTPGSAKFFLDDEEGQHQEGRQQLQLCFPDIGCIHNLNEIPSATRRVLSWSFVVIPIISCSLLIYAALHYRRGKRIKGLKEENTKQLINIQNLEQAKKRAEEEFIHRIGKPSHWTTVSDGDADNDDNDNDKILVEVHATESEYWDTAERIKETMTDAHISKLWRIQNLPLWKHYSLHKEKLVGLNGIDNLNETTVFHGTSRTDPGVIYTDTQDGFLVQYARDGLWGRGIYFAKQSNYSEMFAYQQQQQQQSGDGSSSSSSPSWSPYIGGTGPGQRSNLLPGEREIFQVKLLVGYATFMDRNESIEMERKCSALKIPPTRPNSNNLRYNTVTGKHAGSDVYVVYENGRAFPEYLIRYYRGNRIQDRTPFEDRDDAARHAAAATNTATTTDCIYTPATSQSDEEEPRSLSTNHIDIGTPSQLSTTLAQTIDVTWEFLDDGRGNSSPRFTTTEGCCCWRPFGIAQQQEIEFLYRTYYNRQRSNDENNANNTTRSTNTLASNNDPILRIQRDGEFYEINVSRMIETHCSTLHERDIRRKVGTMSRV